MNKISFNKALAVVKLNLRTAKAAYLVCGIAALTILASNILFLMFNRQLRSDWRPLSMGSLFWIIPFMAAAGIGRRNLDRIIHLGGRRQDYWLGSFLSYALLAVLTPLAELLVFCTIDRFISLLSGHPIRYFSLNLAGYGLEEYGYIPALLHYGAFIFFFQGLIHSFAFSQGKLAGWITDGLLAVFFVSLIRSPAVQKVVQDLFEFIASIPGPFAIPAIFLVLGTGIYALSIPLVYRKPV